MQLLIAGGIDANDHILPLTYALVPIECKEWWLWFLKHFARANSCAVEGDYVFISDREKGLALALEAVFLNAIPSHCCQHIANNVETNHGVKCRPLF
jgi:hypothetical protein